MIKNLFNEIGYVIPINKLSKLDFSFFKTCPKIVIENTKVVSEFYIKAYSVQPQFYHAVPIYNSIANDSTYRFCIIYTGDDRIFVSFKIIQIVKTKQIRLIGNPISKNDNYDNEKLVLSEFLKLPFVKIAVAKNNAITEFNYKSLPEYDDYYLDVYNKTFNSNYKSKYGINRILNYDDFTIDVFSGIKDINKLEQLCTDWESDMNNSGHQVSKKTHESFMKFLTSDSESVIKIALYYLDVPISLQIALIDPITSIQYLLYMRHLGRSCNYDEVSKPVIKSLTEVQIWLLRYAKDLGFFQSNLFFMAGCRPSEHRLLKHKQQISDGVIKYLLSE